MEAAVIAAIAAILGLALGRFWDTRAEQKRWRRDQQIRVYEKFSATHYDVREAMRILALAAKDTPEADAAENRLRALGAEYNQAMVAVWLHGSKPVTEAVRQLDHDLFLLIEVIRAKQLTWEEFRNQRSAASASFEGYVEAVRKELKRPRLKVTLTTVPLSSSDAGRGVGSGTAASEPPAAHGPEAGVREPRGSAPPQAAS